LATAEHYRDLGEQALLDLFAQEHAVVWHEAEAKISDRCWPSVASSIDPNHLLVARARLLEREVITQSRDQTRGGRSIPIFTPTDTRRRKRAIEDASARKRLLQTRYLSWASGSATGGAGIIGPAGEAVVHASLRQAAPHGYTLVQPDRGEVHRLLNDDVPGGPLDNAAWLNPLDRNTFTPTGQSFLVPIEVKNIRPWIYPTSRELHQLLHKAAAIQQTHPEINIVPVLVCRRAHYVAFKMATQLGFYILETKRQYIRPNLPDPAHLEEVRQELGYLDLEPHDGPINAMVRHFTHLLPARAAEAARRWKIIGPPLVDDFKTLRPGNLSHRDRSATVDEIAEQARVLLGEDPTWRRLPEETDPDDSTYVWEELEEPPW
jgi:hypothetical protein